MENKFGGSWTKDKLTRLKKYLDAYSIIFHKNLKAQKLSTIYVDAFAGTGAISSSSTGENELIIELQKLRKKYPNADIQIVRDEANACLTAWCRKTDWTTNRAVVFLDPYGMQVGWPLIQAIAKTEAVDLWILFPSGLLTACL